MSKTQSSIAVTVAVVLAVFAGGWFLLVSPQRSEAAELRATSVTLEQSNALLRVKLRTLQEQAKGLPEQEAKLAALSKQIPSSAALPAVVRNLTAAATASGVSLVGITPTAPIPVGAPAVTVPTETGAVTPPAGAILSAIPIDVSLTGSFVEIERFVNRVELLQRSFLVTSFVLENPDSAKGGRELRLALTGRVFTASPQTAATVVPVPVASPAE